MTLSLKSTVQAKRIQTAQEIKYSILQLARGIVRLQRKKILFADILHLEVFLESISDKPWALNGWIQALHNILGSPMDLYSQSLKHHARPYWNPSNQVINIHSLGLVGDLGEAIDSVQPGDQVMIPHGYTLGGKRSAINGVAPQLRPLPVAAIDLELDLSATSYNEWCAFNRADTSTKCCKDQRVWAVKANRTICRRCGKHA